MTVRDWLPQAILVFFLLVGNVSIMKSADEKTFRTTIFGTIIIVSLLWWGGFFGR
jgi:hypothetical protein